MAQVVWPTNDHIGTRHAEVSRMDDLQRCVGHAASALQIRPSRPWSPTGPTVLLVLLVLFLCLPSPFSFTWRPGTSLCL